MLLFQRMSYGLRQVNPKNRIPLKADRTYISEGTGMFIAELPRMAVVPRNSEFRRKTKLVAQK